MAREAVDVSSTSPVLGARRLLIPILTEWAGSQLRGVKASGSFAKGTANLSGTDLDLFISLLSDTTGTLKEIYTRLNNRLKEKGFTPRQQDVSINIPVGAYRVDLVPAIHQGGSGEFHSLYKRRSNTWILTNIDTHIATVRNSGRADEIRLIKLWRDQKRLDFPSFYLELVVIAALSGARGSLSENVMTVVRYLTDKFPTARFVDPADSNNIVSDDLSVAQRATIAAEASRALSATNWSQIVV